MKEKWFEDIAARFGLGRVIEPARPLSGGLMHQMFALTTERGKYAVKLLNPHVMARPEARAISGDARNWKRGWKKKAFPSWRREG